MKLVFLTDCFPPYAPGGGEWSAFYLAKDLVKKGYSVTILTPNLGSVRTEEIGGIRVIRFPFYRKVPNINQIPSNFWYTNPLWFFWTSLVYFYYFTKEEFEIIHIHGKYSIPPAVFVNYFLGRKVVATIRDYLVLCNYGMCLMRGNKACNLSEYFKNDFKIYWENYIEEKNITNLILNIVFAIWGRLATNYLNFFAKRCKVIVLSNSQKKIFRDNGFKNVQYIYNSVSFKKEIISKKRLKQILYAGRLSYGKGASLLLKILPRFLDTYPQYKVIIVGEGRLKADFVTLASKYKNLVVKGSLKHLELMKLYAKSEFTVMPSLWPEPFGRVALESISMGTPVITTNKGGLPEIVMDKRWGIVVDAESEKLLKGIILGLKNSSKYQKNLIKDYKLIKSKFGNDVLIGYMKVYKGEK